MNDIQLQKKAKKAGFTLRKGFQHYHNKEWGYVMDATGERIVGYEIFDNRLGCNVRESYTDLYDYALTLEEATAILKSFCGEKGIVF